MGLADTLIKKLWGTLQELIDKYGNFIKKPNAMVALNIAVSKIIDKLLAYLKDLIQKGIQEALISGVDKLLISIFANPGNITDDQIKKYVSKHRGLQNVLQYSGSNLNESVVGDITLACTDPNYYDDLFNNLISSLNVPSKKLEGDDFIKIVQRESDFDDRVSGFANITPKINDLAFNVKGVLSWIFMVYVIVLKVREFLTQNEYPSKFRGKYLGRLLRIVSAILSSTAKQTGEGIRENIVSGKNVLASSKQNIITTKDNGISLIKGLIDSLKILDTAIGAVLFAGLLYEANRRLLQERSFKELNDQTKEMLCDNSGIEFASFSNTLVNIDPLVISNITLPLFCPILDNMPSIIEPIEEKINPFSCPIPTPTIASIVLGNVAPLSSLATKALYSNSGSSPLYSLVHPGDTLQPGTPLWSDHKKTIIYSEIGGTVISTNYKNKPNDILIDNIYEPDQTILQKSIEDFSTTHQQLTTSNLFIKDWYVDTMLPRILAASPMNDASISSAEWATIIYPLGGAEKRYQKALKDENKLTKTYNKEAQRTIDKDKIKTHAQNETLHIIKDNLDTLNIKYYKALNKIGTTAINQGKHTVTKKSEFTLIEYYMGLYNDLIETKDLSQGLEYEINTPPENKVENKILTNFTKGINEILIQRYFIDKYKFELITEKINVLGKELDKNYSIPQESKKTYWKLLEETYEKAIKTKKSPVETLKLTSLSILSWGKNNKSLSTAEKDILKYRIITLYSFVKTIATLTINNYSTEETPFEATSREAAYISNFFDQLWNFRTEGPEKIKEIGTYIDDVGRSSILPSTIIEDDEEILLYSLSDSRSCPVPEVTNERLSPFSKYEFKDIEYWLKYCSYATLASIASLPPNWGTGFPPPLGPIPFPTVYIPIKAFQLAWGILVIGLTLTGIYPFPWVMIANLSTEHHVPLIDPATIMKKNIDTLKKTIGIQIKDFKQNLIKKTKDKTEKEIKSWDEDIERITIAQIKLKKNKPKRNRTEESLGDRVKALAEYKEKLSAWTISTASLVEEKIRAKNKRFIASIKFDILNKAYNGEKIKNDVDPEVIVLQKTEDGIDKLFDKLDKLVAAIDPFIAALPISTEPGSANFGPTLKNPNPIQKMADGLNESINNKLLAKITKPFDLDREDLMSSNYSSKLDKSIINSKFYMNTLAASSVRLILIDPFPKYEMLKANNLAWTVKFLLPKWSAIGGGQYGFPGFPKYAIG